MPDLCQFVVSEGSDPPLEKSISEVMNTFKVTDFPIINAYLNKYLTRTKGKN